MLEATYSRKSNNKMEATWVYKSWLREEVPKKITYYALDISKKQIFIVLKPLFVTVT